MSRFILLICVFSFLLFGCEDDNDDTIVSILTTTNYFYEGDALEFYLENEIALREDSIALWEAVSPNDPDYDEAQSNIEQALLEITELNSQIAEIIPLVSRVPVLPIPPVPPPPPCTCLPLPDAITYVLLLPDTETFNFSLTDANQQVLASTNANTIVNILPTVSDVLYQSFEFANGLYEGEATLNIETNNSSYSIQVYLYN